MANEEHLAILRQGVEVWNDWRAANPDVLPDLSRADIQKADLHEAELRFTDLQGAVLIETNLYDANLYMADLRRTHMNQANLRHAYLAGANLSRASLQIADLSAADLDGADLVESYLGTANFSGARLDGANLRGAELFGTIFSGNDLRNVLGLDSVKHKGPSAIGIDTLVRSKGKIPVSFLRGCGVPDSWIEYLPSLIGALEPIQFYSCFISHSTKDEEFARRLHSAMRDHHLRVWFAPEELKGGAKLHEQIDQAIRVHDKLVLVLSEQSIQSEWVMTEIRKARKAELRDKRRKLFPIRLVDMDTLRDWECFDADTGKDLAVEVREYFIPDFSHWKDHDSFERAFARFLKDLQATEAPPIPREAPKVSGDVKAGAPESIIEIKKRRLRLLEEQQARKGQDTEPHILMEIEDLRRDLGFHTTGGG